MVIPNQKPERVWNDPPCLADYPDPSADASTKKQPDSTAFTLGGGVSPEIRNGIVSIIVTMRKAFFINMVIMAGFFLLYSFTLAYLDPTMTGMELVHYLAFPATAIIIMHSFLYIIAARSG
jgi:hypothetical protein